MLKQTISKHKTKKKKEEKKTNYENQETERKRGGEKITAQIYES